MPIVAGCEVSTPTTTQRPSNTKALAKAEGQKKKIELVPRDGIFKADTRIYSPRTHTVQRRPLEVVV